MLSPFWVLWVVFLLVFLVTPIGYGWAYRGWGLPYPRYVQRRRAVLASASGRSPLSHQAWGRAGDFVWVGLVIAMLWACLAAVALR